MCKETTGNVNLLHELHVITSGKPIKMVGCVKKRKKKKKSH